MDILQLFNHPLPPRTLAMPYVIAEAGVNHEGSMELAKRLIDEAAEGGADAIKFQTYKAETLASKDSPAYWDLSREPTTSQYELFKRHDSFWKNEFEKLARYCQQSGITFLSTPFDLESAGFLNDLMPAFKISSSDITNKPFIEYICKFGKPVILSTGASWLAEIAEAVQWIEACGNPLALLHCVLNYPTANENAALGMIPALKRVFPAHLAGYSDHTLPGDMHILEIAVILGARIIEKHFTHDKTLAGNDHYHAMDKDDLRNFYKRISELQKIIGTFEITCLPEEAAARANARRSLVTANPIQAGSRITGSDLTWKRPASGISPKYIDQVIGMIVRENIKADTVLQWDLLKRP